MAIVKSKSTPSCIEGDGFVARNLVVRQIFSMSRSTADRRERADARWPAPFLVGGRVCYRRADVRRYLDELRPIARPPLRKAKES